MQIHIHVEIVHVLIRSINVAGIPHTSNFPKFSLVKKLIRVHIVYLYIENLHVHVLEKQVSLEKQVLKIEIEKNSSIKEKRMKNRIDNNTTEISKGSDF